MRSRRSKVRKTMHRLRSEWAPPLIVGAIGGFLGAVFGIPTPWLIGPMVAGLVAAVGFRANYRIPPLAFSIAQVAIGLTVGLSFSIETIHRLGAHLPIVIGVLVTTTGLSLANGYLLARWTGIDRASGLLGCIPGAASAMVASADKVGADALVVAVLQYVRILLILALVPPAISAWARHLEAAGWTLLPTHGGSTQTVPTLITQSVSPETLSPVIGVLLLVALGWIGAGLGRRLGLPSPYVLGPMMLATATVTVFPTVESELSVPPPLFNLALTVIGTSVGLRFSGDILKSLRRVVIVELLLLTVLLLLSALLAALMARITGIDLMSAVLGNVPGALEAIVATAVDLQTNAPIVAAMQTMRSLALLCLGPWIVDRLHRAQRPGTSLHTSHSE